MRLTALRRVGSCRCATAAAQWEALFLLVAGVTVNQLPSACPADSKLAGAVPPLLPMVLCTLSTVVVPSTASVFNEYALKRHRDTSVFLQVRLTLLSPGHFLRLATPRCVGRSAACCSLCARRTSS